MTPITWLLHHCARLRPASFAQLTLFLGIILLATPLWQERWLFWALLQLMFLDALLVSLLASNTRQRLRKAFSWYHCGLPHSMPSGTGLVEDRGQKRTRRLVVETDAHERHQVDDT
jgi:hypothetical protein